MQLLRHTPSGQEVVTCGLCDADDTRVRCTKFDSTIVQCRRCGLWYVNPRHPKDVIWQRYSPRYFEEEYLPSQGVSNGQVDHAINDGRNADLLRLLEARVGSKGHLFEIGAGAGLFLAAAARAGWTASGIELSEAAVEFGRCKLGVNLAVAAAEDLPASAPACDAVVMLDVIEHLFNPSAVLSIARGLLRRDGVLMIATPNINALSRFALGAQWSILSPLEHLYYFSEKTLRQALTVHGFTDVRFVRQREAWSVFDTMNARSTHEPGSRRALRYERWVSTLGRICYRRIQAAGLGDILLALARAE